MNPRAAYVTLLTKTSYLPGTLVLDHGLRSVNSKYPLVVMVTPSLPFDARETLRKSRIVIREVATLQPEDGAHRLAAHDARFADTWTKLRCIFHCKLYRPLDELMSPVEALSWLSMRYVLWEALFFALMRAIVADCPPRLWHDCHEEHGRTNGDGASKRRNRGGTCLCLQSTEVEALPPRLVSHNFIIAHRALIFIQDPWKLCTFRCYTPNRVASTCDR